MSNMRLDRLLANLGYGSRKDATLMVRYEQVTLNDAIVKDSDLSILLEDVRQGKLKIDGEVVDPPAPFTIMLHKPIGYSCSHDEKGALVYDLLPERWKFRKPALSCAGRLDKDSTGQVILTDDGDLLHRIIHPKLHAEKHYAVTLRDALAGNEAKLFATGDFLMQGDFKPLKPATWLPQGDNSGTMILQEGRYHQIRRMFQTLGNEVVTLHRFKTGNLDLGDIEKGTYRSLTDKDINAIF
jgi:16S rRNA pseudouridine516 synthase